MLCKVLCTLCSSRYLVALSVTLCREARFFDAGESSGYTHLQFTLIPSMSTVSTCSALFFSLYIPTLAPPRYWNKSIFIVACWEFEKWKVSSGL